MAKKEKGDVSADKKKGKDRKASKKGKGGQAGGVSVAAHPRAAAAVKRAKGFGGLGGFLLAAYLSWKAGVPPDQIGLRALAFGVAGWLVAWACAVAIWRHLVIAELRTAVETGRATYGPVKEPLGRGVRRGRPEPAAKAQEVEQATDEEGKPPADGE